MPFLEQTVEPSEGRLMKPFGGRMMRALLATDILFETEVAEKEELFLRSLGTGPVHRPGQRGGGGCIPCYDTPFHVLHDSKLWGGALNIHCA